MTRFKCLKTISRFATILAFLVFVGSFIYAQEAAIAPKGTPSPTSSFCVNKVTGVMRLVLAEAGISQACHKNELPITLATLEAIASGGPTPAPSATPTGSPTSSASPSGSPTATPVTGSLPMMVDVNGKIVGPIVGNIAGGSANLVVLRSAGVSFEVLAAQSGFVDQKNGSGGSGGGYGPQFVEYFPTPDCSGPAYLPVGHTVDPAIDDEGKDIGVIPLIVSPQLPIDQPNLITPTIYVWNQIVYFPGPPYLPGTQAMAMSGSALTFFAQDPAAGGGTCSTGGPDATMGVVQNLNLTTLDVTAPFHVQQ